MDHKTIGFTTDFETNNRWKNGKQPGKTNKGKMLALKVETIKTTTELFKFQFE